MASQSEMDAYSWYPGWDQSSRSRCSTGTALTPDAAAWSGDGATALLYSRKTGWIQMFTGFPVGERRVAGEHRRARGHSRNNCG